MIFLETDLAIFKRLVGYPLDSQGLPLLGEDQRPVNREVIGPPDMNPFEQVWDPIKQEMVPVFPRLPSYGIRLPQPTGDADIKRGLTSRNPNALGVTAFQKMSRGLMRQVPVFDDNLFGRKHTDIYPAVTFRWIDTEPDFSTYLYHDPIERQDTRSTPESIVNGNGDTVQSGYALNYVRPLPHGYKPSYMITGWAKTAWEAGLLSAQILALFPMKGALTITQQDGSEYTCDMLLDRTVTLDPPTNPLSHAEEEQRLYGRGYVYTVEAYLDNTTNDFGVGDSAFAARKVPAVLERLFEINLMMSRLAVSQQGEVDLNDLELKPITG